MHRSRWTKEQEDLIVEMLQAGHPLRLIAKRLNRTAYAVEKRCQLMGKKVREIRSTPGNSVYSAYSAARLFGVHVSVVLLWIEKKWLKACRNQTLKARGESAGRRPTPYYMIVESTIEKFMECREYWPAWSPAAIIDAGWRTYAEAVRLEASGEWLSVKDVARCFICDPHTVQCWISRGMMDSVEKIRVCNAWYFWSADINGWRPIDRRVERDRTCY